MGSYTFSLNDEIMLKFKEYIDKDNKDKNRELEKFIKDGLDSLKPRLNKHELLFKKQELINQLRPIEEELEEIQKKEEAVIHQKKILIPLQKELEEATLDLKNYKKETVDIIPTKELGNPENEEILKKLKEKSQRKYDIEEKIREYEAGK